MRLIDVHAHDYPDIYRDAVRDPRSGLEHYVRDDGRIVVLQDGAVALAMPDPLPTLGQRLELMDRSGVVLQALSIPAPNVYRLPLDMRVEVCRQTNAAFSATAALAPGRFRVLASLPLPDVDAAMAELETVMGDPETAGIAVCTTIDRRTLDDPLFAPLWAELDRRETTVFVHPTTACCTDGTTDYALALGIDFLAETTLAVARLVYSGLLERHPGIRWIFSHVGGTVPFLIHRFDNYFRQFPECRANIDRPPSEILRAVYFDTVTTHAPALRCAVETFGPEQLVFGTDYPHVPGGLEVFVRTLEAAGLDDAGLDLVTHQTAADLLGMRTLIDEGGAPG